MTDEITQWEKAIECLKNGDIKSYEEFAEYMDFGAWDQNSEHDINTASDI